MNASPASPYKLVVCPFGTCFRKSLLGPLFLMLLLLTASVAHAATYTVTDTSDDVADTGSLRYALSQVNAGTGGDTINFSGVTGTITVGSTLPISESVTINGPGANVLAISGNDAVEVFSTAGSAANVTISGLTITHGRSSEGAGIYITQGAMTVNNCTFSYNTGVSLANGDVGAALSLNGGTSLTVNNSTFFNNAAEAGGNPLADGGAIYAVDTLVVNNSTFYNNSAVSDGGAIRTQLGTKTTIRNSTIVGNTAGGAGGGVWINALAPTLTNSIIAGNTAPTGTDYQCVTGCGTTPTGNLIGGGTPALGPLQYNGGPTMTMIPLQSGTGIIGAGLNSTLATDQRGIPRPTSGASDLGSVQTYNLVVTTTADSTDSGATCTGTDTCSLRDALTLANTQGAGDIITVTGLSGTIALNSPLPDDTADLNINGPGANQFTISGGGSYGIINITNSAAVTNISGVTIANGSSSSNGGGISNNGSMLTLSNCALSNNSATGGASGGGIANTNAAGSATVTDCTFSGNSAFNGGGVYNLGALVVTNSTFSGNTAPGTAGSGSGGGIFNQGAAEVTSSTLSGNTAGTGGGIFDNSPGTVAVVNSLVAGNTETVSPGDDCSACGAQTPFNLISTTGTPITAAQVMLGPLAYNGLNQAVETMLPFPGSPAIQTGDPTQLPTDLTTDERQLPRTINGKLDMGAVETNYTSIQFVQQPSNTMVHADISPAVTISVTESGTTTANIPIPITFTGTGVLSGTLTETTLVPNGGGPALATFGDLNGNTAGTGDTLTTTLTVTPVGVTPAQTLIATSTPFDITQVTSDVPVVTVGPASPVYGQPETVNITVPTTGITPPTGVVTIYNNGNPIGTGTLGPNGTVTVTIPGGTLPAGPNSITVGYPGDGNYASSTSVAVPVIVSTVTSIPTLVVGPASPTAGQPVTVAVIVSTVGSTPPTGTVTIYDNGNPIGTGTLGSNGTVTVDIPGGLPAGTNTITAGYPGAGNYGPSTSAPTSVTVTAAAPPSDFTVRSSTGPQTVLPGQNATYSISVAPVNGAFSSAVTLSASGLPAGATVTFNPPSVTPGASAAPTTMTIQTAKQTAELRQLGSTAPLMLGLLLPLFGLKRGRRKLHRCCLLLLFAVLSIGAITGLTGCSPGGFFGQAPQTYTVTVTGTSGSLQHSTTVTLTVQ